MSSEEIRQAFTSYFISKGHAHMPSSSLVPSDPSVLLTTAGMQQFKPYFTGEADANKDLGSLNAVSIQKCFRTSDIEEVGDNTHLTMFEMLGNFSFGGYFKKEAIQFAHEFITKHLKLPISYVTVFKGNSAVPKDLESKDIWKGLGVTDIREEGVEDVFWGPTGTSGPCGPTTEIYCKNAEGKDVEIWNIVFNQFFYPGSREQLLAGAPDKQLVAVKTPGIDTGAGFERLVCIKQNTVSVYDTDVFADLMQAIRQFNQHGALPVSVCRIIADHFRSAAFLIADGVRPSNKEAGYILRRLIRRILAHKIKYDIHANIFSVLFPILQSKFSSTYPELKNPEILKVLEDEQGKFEKAVAAGLAELKKHPLLDAPAAFAIASTFGLNFELLKEMAPEATGSVTKHDFDNEFKKHQELSRAGAEKKFGGHGLLLDTGELKAKDEVELKKVTRLHTATHLLQAALREVLGNEVHQAGSDITAERTRFDFTFGRKLTPEEIKKAEEVVNREINKDLPVAFKEMPKDEAMKTGALFFFKAKYGEKVKVYYMGHRMEDAFSKEFCGGPHVDHTNMVGKFRIAKEEAVSAGVRRIRGVIEP